MRSESSSAVEAADAASRIEATVAVMDSGIGGLPYLECARVRLPGVRFVYLADTEGFPYGKKSTRHIVELVLDRVARLFRFHDPDILLLACNTASQAALGTVRNEHPGRLFVGTVPAVRLAAAGTGTGAIGILATDATIRSSYLDALVDSYAAGCTVVRQGASPLVDFIERDPGFFDPRARMEAVDPYVQRFVEAGVDRIVLGCTHFLHVAEEIKTVASARSPVPVAILDSREGVAGQLARVARARLSRRRRAAERDDLLLVTAEPEDPLRYRRIAGMFGIGVCGALER